MLPWRLWASSCEPNEIGASRNRATLAKFTSSPTLLSTVPSSAAKVMHADFRRRNNNREFIQISAEVDRTAMSRTNDDVFFLVSRNNEVCMFIGDGYSTRSSSSCSIRVVKGQRNCGGERGFSLIKSRWGVLPHVTHVWNEACGPLRDGDGMFSFFFSFWDDETFFWLIDDWLTGGKGM
jgi:hypothetical protein